ncbi:hypothetical protein ACOME3_004309 [Neoechinorhynchus agilis]
MTWLAANSMRELLENLKRANVIVTQQVYDVMLKVDRKFFCPNNTYNDSPQSIGYSVTISAPHMHAHALEILRSNLQPGKRVLDVGSGSGYLCACFAYMVQPSGKVVGVEHIKQLVDKSVENLNSLDSGLLNSGLIEIIEADGREGNVENSPYDAIHVGAACTSKPQSLIDQLNPGGVLLAPVGSLFQTMIKYIKGEDGKVKEEQLMDVRYVPLTDKKYQVGNEDL